jgi:hypothetical protein
MIYDPFARGDAPVGVMSREIHDSAHDRTLTAMPPIGELCSPASAEAFLCGMGTAHMDAHVKDMQPAIDLLASDLHAVLAPHDVTIEIVDD